MAAKTRDSNIELLRILVSCGVVILHYNGNVAFDNVQAGTVNYYILNGLEALCICAVNLFMLISGYFLSTNGRRKVIKTVELVIEVMVIGAVLYLGLTLLSGESISGKALLSAMIPNNYFVTLYITVYLLSPYINILLDRLDEKQVQILLGMCLLLFAVWPTILDLCTEKIGIGLPGLYTTNTAGSQYGYSLINFVLMYMVGAYIRRYDLGKNQKSWVLLLTLIICVGVIFVWQMFSHQTARAYCNPFVIAEAAIVFVLFRRMKLNSKIVNGLSKAAFTCFLVHGVFLGRIGIPSVVNGSTPILLLHVFVSAAGIFLISWVVWKIYDFASRPVMRWLGRHTAFLDRYISVES